MVSRFDSVFVQSCCISKSFQMLNTAKQSANSDCAQVGSRPNLCSHLSQTIFFFCVSQLRGGANGQLFSLSNSANTKTISEGITQRGSEVIYRSFSSIPNDIYYWVLPQSFKGDKVKEKRKEKNKVESRLEEQTVKFSPSSISLPFPSHLVVPRHVVK